MSDQLTPAQLEAATVSGADILVSASAGSGKTKVLVDRIVRQVVAGADLTRMLIATFTKAATAEMKLRIQNKLKARLNDETQPLTSEQRRHLSAQVALANAAPIMTLDAFSMQVVQRYYYVIDLDPAFRMMTDDTERLMLQTRVWEDLRENFYTGEHAAAFEALATNFATSSDPAALQDVVFEIYRFAMTTPDPVAWLNQLPAAYTSEAALMKALWPSAQTSLRAAEAELLEAQATLSAPKLAKVAANVATSLAAVQTALALEQPSYEAAWSALSAIAFDRWPGGKFDPELKADKDAAKAQRDLAKATVAPLQAIFAIKPADLKQAMPQVQQLMATLQLVSLEFYHALAAEKRRQQVQDFGDIAQNALKILNAPDPSAEPGSDRTVGAVYRAQFDAVMVDEYQDINQLQEAVLTAVSQDHPGNRFMVGDAKQSIYGFRLADPQLFLAKYRLFGNDEATGKRVILNQNFRSSQNVLAFNNLVFSQIMDRAVGQIDYTEKEALKPGPLFPEDQLRPTEFLIHETGTAGTSEDDQEEPSPEKAAAEAQMVIARIQELVNDPTETLYQRDPDGTGHQRRIRYQDITLLTRSRSNNIALQTAFAQAGVPIVIADAQNYFKTTELMVMLALLRVIDNPRQEIPLTAVLRSPLVGLSADQLALIRLTQDGPYDEAVQAFAAATDGTAFKQQTRAKVQAFLQQLAELRDFAREHELSALIWHIYEVTGYLDYVGGQPGGLQRQANLRALAARAASYESGGFKGLFAFIHFIETMQKQDKDLAMPVTLAPDVNAVSLMTIHGSKGLEFPIVFLMSTDKQFNQQDLRRPFILTQAVAGVKWLDESSHEVYSLPQWQLAKLAKNRQLLAEEMRLLYVALTRAEQQLFIVGSGESREKLETHWAQLATSEAHLLPESVRAGAGCMLDWLGMAIARTGVLDEAPSLPDLNQYQKAGVRLNFVAQPQVSTSAEAAKPVTQPPLDLDLTAWFDYQYPYAQTANTTGFQSVSEIKRAFEDPDTVELVESGRQLGGNRLTGDFAAPAFMATGAKVPATVIGSAAHLVLQMQPLTGPLDEAALSHTIDQLVTNGSLPAAVAKQIPLAELVRFYQTPLGQALQANAATVHREAPFSLLMPADQLFTDLAQEPGSDILIHGVIDGYYETANGIVLFDYKTDHIGNQQAKVVARYQPQLNLYAKALALATDKKVIQKLLVLLETGQVVTLD